MNAYFNDEFCREVLKHLTPGYTVEDVNEFVMGGEPEARPTAEELAAEMLEYSASSATADAWRYRND